MRNRVVYDNYSMTSLSSVHNRHSVTPLPPLEVLVPEHTRMNRAGGRVLLRSLYPRREALGCRFWRGGSVRVISCITVAPGFTTPSSSETVSKSGLASLISDLGVRCAEESGTWPATPPWGTTLAHGPSSAAGEVCESPSAQPSASTSVSTLAELSGGVSVGSSSILVSSPESVKRSPRSN